MTNNPLQKVKAPAIGLIIAGCLNGGFALVILVSGLARLAGLIREQPLPTDQAERIGYFFGTFAAYGVALLTLLVAPVVVYGAVKMMNGQKYGLAKASAVLSIIPLTSCCCIAGVPLGIWAFVVLSKPDVKAFFR